MVFFRPSSSWIFGVQDILPASPIPPGARNPNLESFQLANFNLMILGAQRGFSLDFFCNIKFISGTFIFLSSNIKLSDCLNSKNNSPSSAFLNDSFIIFSVLSLSSHPFVFILLYFVTRINSIC